MIKSVILCALLAVGLVFAQGDRWENAPAHEVPHCDIPPRAAKDPANVAPCKCIGMVAKIQEGQIDICFAKHWSHPLPVPEDAQLREQYRNPAIDACIADEVSDHCEIVARPHRHENACRTSCKPERCGCQDGVCRAHGSGVY